MKLVHISDIHINAAPILDDDPVGNFKLCMAHVDKYHSDADLVVITGDLTHLGLQESYEELRVLLDGWQMKPLLMIGNHDNRKTFQENFPEVPQDPNGYVQYVHKTEMGHFILLDTEEPGTHAGHFGADRQEWFREQLETAKRENADVFVMMHHNPVEVGVPNADLIGLMDGKEFRAILRDYRAIIRHIFFGHCHYTLSGSVCGIPMSAPRSTNHPCIADFEDVMRMGVGPLPPTYNVCLISDESEVIHTMEFDLDDQIEWVALGADGWVAEEANV